MPFRTVTIRFCQTNFQVAYPIENPSQMFQSASSPAATADSSALLLTPANNAAADVITPPAGEARFE